MEISADDQNNDLPEGVNLVYLFQFTFFLPNPRELKNFPIIH